MPLDLHILNATSILNDQLSVINVAFESASLKAEELLKLDVADMVVSNNPSNVIPELGVGGYTDSANKIIYISLDADKKVTPSTIEACMNHELYHLKRHQVFGTPNTLKDRAIDEGLACMYEFESNKTVPIYAKQKVDDQQAEFFSKHLDDKRNIDRWFFGADNISKWLGYSMGFRIVKSYKMHVGKDSVEMLALDNGTIYSGSLI